MSKKTKQTPKTPQKRIEALSTTALDTLHAYTTQTIMPANAEKPFDSYHYWYYRQGADNSAIKNARDQMIWNHMHMQMARGDVDTIYVPCAITGGIRAHQLAVKDDYRVPVDIAGQMLYLRTTQDMNLSPASSERVLKDVVNPNERDAMGRSENHARTFPDFNILLPYNKEGAVRISRQDSDSSYARPPEEWDFMGGWYTDIDHDRTKGELYERDIPFSRNSNWEMMRGLYNAIGMMNGITRNSAEDFKFVKGDGTLATVADIVQGNIEYLVYALDNDFYAKEAATSLAWTLEIEKRLRDQDYNKTTATPLDSGIIADQLKEELYGDEEWAIEARAKMDTLRPYAETLLKQHFIGHVPEEFMTPLEQDYHDARANLPPVKTQPQREGEPAPRPAIQPLAEKLADLGFAAKDPVLAEIQNRLQAVDGYLQAVHPNETQTNEKSLRKIATPHFAGSAEAWGHHAHMSPAPRQITHKTDIYDKDQFGAAIFDRHYFSRIKSKREQIAVRMAIGAMLSVHAPRRHGGWTYVSADFKKGDAGATQADARKIDDLRMLESDYENHDKFLKEIVEPNIAQCTAAIEDEKQRQQAAYGSHSPILSAIDTDLRSATAFGKLPDLTAVQGPPKLSSEAKMALRISILDLMAHTLRMSSDNWAGSDKEVQHVLRATLSQLGLVNRGNQHKTNMLVTDAHGQEMSLYDRLLPICDHIKDCVSKSIDAPDHVWVAAALIQLHEMLHDPEYNKDRNGGDIIDYNDVHPSFADYRYSSQRDAMDKLINGDPDAADGIEHMGMRQFILENCAGLLEPESLPDLDPDFRKYWQEQSGMNDYRIAPDEAQHRVGMRGPDGGP